MPLPAYSPHVPATLLPSDYERDEVEHQELTAHAELTLREAGYRTRARTLHGDPRDVICRLAAEEATDLIVMGSHGRTGIAKMLLGSVASHVVAHAPCSVLVVKLPGWRKG
jgi:nucleotide-binding universal stress UspA family protein